MTRILSALVLMVAMLLATVQATEPINLNTATAAQLETLPNIGPVLAARIIEGRPYASVEELVKVKGIKAKKLAQLRPLVSVKGGKS